MITTTPTKQRKYFRVWTSNTYQAEIYDNCYSRIAVRGDGNRARVRIDGTYWHGNNGGFKTYEYYIDGRQAVVEMMRSLRKLQIRAIKAGESKHASVIAQCLVGEPTDALYF